MVSVLLVEDDTYVHELLTRMLTLRGHKVLADAFDGMEAVDIFQNLGYKPDIILMDYRMPDMNGIEATKRIIEIDPSAKILFLSADGTVKDSAIESGACDFIKKPISCVEIVAFIEKHASESFQNELACSCRTQ